MSARLLRIAAVYLAVGVTMGIVMGITQNFVLAPVHAHINLLGWASLGVMGIVYHLHPQAAQTRLARIHFWVHTIALPVFMVGLAMMLTGHAAFVPLVIAGASAVAIGVFVFVVNLWRCVRPMPAATAVASAARIAT